MKHLFLKAKPSSKIFCAGKFVGNNRKVIWEVICNSKVQVYQLGCPAFEAQLLCHLCCSTSINLSDLTFEKGMRDH
jgi:hypothetical protein